ncbi:hypothetical protein LIER_32739 [Lithospermum erythrorhizon]|uniref:F-box domain-containing protein n=1 Tax=Lithospermum erythrorhizon TaxID=34254 RepID=A0AAV3RUP0_LITER
MIMENEYEFTELIPSLPEELALECLTRLHYSVHMVASQVCKKWNFLLKSKEFYYHRKQTGHTQIAACFIQALPTSSDGKPIGQPSYGVSIFDSVSQNWDRVDSVPKYPNGLPLFCQISSSEGKLILMGGWNPSSWEPVKDVFVYEFTTRRWTQCVDMPSKRSFFAMAAFEGRVYIAGGHDENKNALDSAWVFDIEKNEWTELTRMSEERDECQGLVIDDEFWVVSGYDTDNQGRFKSSAEVLGLRNFTSSSLVPLKERHNRITKLSPLIHPNERHNEIIKSSTLVPLKKRHNLQWRRVDDAWNASQCPRSRVGKGKNGNLLCYTEFNSAVQVSACGVDLGGQTLVTGSAYQGAPHGFYIVDKSDGQNGKLKKIDVPDEFSGIIQSGCCVDI